jgi:ABC-2 type transport system ATP-binding protein
VRIEAVGKRYALREPWILRDVTIQIASGRLVRLEGRNGSGKSTLLRIAAGAMLPSAGRVTGRPHAGYVPERFPAGLAFSAREYLQHMSRIHGLSGTAGQAAVEEWLGRLGANCPAGLSPSPSSRVTDRTPGSRASCSSEPGSRPVTSMITVRVAGAPGAVSTSASVRRGVDRAHALGQRRPQRGAAHRAAA